MKKITLFFFAVFASFAMNAQNGPATSGGAGGTGATSGLNFGLIGVSYEIPVASQISIAPSVGTDLNLKWLIIGVKGNYYFDKLFGLPAAWDVYAGANAGYALWLQDEFDSTGKANPTSDINIGLQIGGRWFWSDKWGVFLEIGGGHTSSAFGGLGITMKM